MKKIIAMVSLLVISSTVIANDGGTAAIKVDQIKMRETAIKNGQEVTVKKIASPRYTITINGGEAEKLQQILPSMSSVFTTMYPESEKLYNDSFKSLGIYSEKSNGVSGKAISISCADAVLNDEGTKITKTGKSECVIRIEAIEDGGESDIYGDVQTFEPKMCK